MDDLTAQVADRWGRKTLSELRDEAVLEDNGTVFESLRVDNGPRLVLIVCVTNAEQIEIIERTVDLSEERPPSDWVASTLQNMVLTTSNVGGLTYEDLRDAYGKRVAVALCGTSREAIRILETLFKTPT